MLRYWCFVVVFIDLVFVVVVVASAVHPRWPPVSADNRRRGEGACDWHVSSALWGCLGFKVHCPVTFHRTKTQLAELGLGAAGSGGSSCRSLERTVGCDAPGAPTRGLVSQLYSLSLSRKAGFTCRIWSVRVCSYESTFPTRSPTKSRRLSSARVRRSPRQTARPVYMRKICPWDPGPRGKFFTLLPRPLQMNRARECCIICIRCSQSVFHRRTRIIHMILEILVSR